MNPKYDALRYEMAHTVEISPFRHDKLWVVKNIRVYQIYFLAVSFRTESIRNVFTASWSNAKYVVSVLCLENTAFLQ